MTLKQELIKVLIGEAIANLNAEESQGTGMGGNLYNRPFSNMYNSLKSAYSTNSLNIFDDNNAFFNILAESLKKIIKDEINSSTTGKDTIVNLIGQTCNRMSPAVSLTLNPSNAYSYQNQNTPMNMYGMTGFVGAGTGLINQQPIGNQYMGQPSTPTTGNTAMDSFLDDVVRFFKDNNIILNGETSLAAFSSSYVKFLKVYKKTIAEQNSAVVYQNIQKRYFGK